MLLVAGKKMAGWSEVEKASGLVPAAEVAPYTWAHRFLPQEAAKMSGGDDERGKVPLPWLNLVARGGHPKKFKWSRSHLNVAITADGKRASYSLTNTWACVVAALGQVTQGRHWFEVKLLNVAVNRNIMVGWSTPGIGLSGTYSDKKGCAW